jgi:hypothetical protein
MLERESIFTPRPRTYETYDEGDPRAYKEGVVRDGVRLRVPITMIDASLPLQRVATVPRNISTGLEGEFALKNFYAVDGSPKGPRRRKVQQRDPFGRESGSFEEEDAAAHRPGFRDAAAVRANTDAGQAASSYAEMCRDLSMPGSLIICALLMLDARRPMLHVRKASATRSGSAS